MVVFTSKLYQIRTRSNIYGGSWVEVESFNTVVEVNYFSRLNEISINVSVKLKNLLESESVMLFRSGNIGL